MRSVFGGLLGISVALAVPHGSAHAGGFAVARFGGEHGHPTTDNPTAIYYNPAGLSLGTGTRLFIEGLLAYRDANYERPAGTIDHPVAAGQSGLGTPADATSANSGTATLSNFIASPFLGVASDLGVKNLGVGLALFAPFGGQASWDKNKEYDGSEAYPGAVDGVQRWSTMDGAIRELYVSGAASYRFPGPRLSIGASISLVEESLNTIRARNAAGTDDLVGADGTLLEGRSLVDVKGTTFVAGVGVIWEPVDDLYLGVSYQSQPGFGETTQEGELKLKLGNTGADTTNINFEQELPDITRIGMRYKPQQNLELRFAADYTRWSVFKKQCLTDRDNPNSKCSLDDTGAAKDDAEGIVVNIWRDWKDTFGIRGGASYWLDPKTEIAGGLTFDTSAVPNYTIDPALMDMNKVVATLGGRFTLRSDLLLNVSYTHVFYFERDVAPRERDANGNLIGLPAPSNVPDHGGVYNQTVGLINLGVEYRF